MDDAELRWKLFQAAKRRDWKTYYEIRERLWQILPPSLSLPRNPNYRIFNPPCYKCKSWITCEACLADLEQETTALI